MASQVTVIGPSARRHVVRTTPGTYLSDVLEQACTKMRLDPSQYGLKHNNKNIDLSRTMRLSGLSSGAKLELTMLSRSPSVVSVALQLPDGTRLLDKFPSNTTLWLILRKFESGVAGGRKKDNFTGRGVPKILGQGASGRLYHETPVLQIMGRDYSSLIDLQKSLGQIGFNDGSVLLKLSFAASETPLEEAMQQIEDYLNSVEPQPDKAAGDKGTSPSREQTNPIDAGLPESEENVLTTKGSPLAELQDRASDSNKLSDTEPTDEKIRSAGIATVADRATLIYRPPSSSTPQAVSAPHNAADYIPTVEHARVHQAGLAKASQNTRLPTDAELAVQVSERAARRASITSVMLKIRFPDESSAVAPFGPKDTTSDLYKYVENLMRCGATEPFQVTFVGQKGKTTQLPRDNQTLIGQVGLEGKVLVQVRWAEGASAEARKAPSMREEVRSLGKDLELPSVPTIADEEESGASTQLARNSAQIKDNIKEKAKGGVPKWLKIGKK